MKLNLKAALGVNYRITVSATSSYQSTRAKKGGAYLRLIFWKLNLLHASHQSISIPLKIHLDLKHSYYL